MKFNLVKTLAKECSIKTIEHQAENSKSEELSLKSLTVEVRVPTKELAHTFAICFVVDAALNAQARLAIECEYWAFFESTQVLTQAFLDSQFTTVNAPAIAYPYLRSFVTNLIVNAGYPAAYLPTINFVEMAKK